MALTDKISALATRVATQFKTIAPRLVPSGGAAGAVLGKSSASNYALAWLAMAARITVSAPGLSGYWKFSDTVIVQWGLVAAGASDTVISFPTPFPNGCWGVVITPQTTQNNGALVEAAAAGNVTAAGFTPRVRLALNGTTGVLGSACFYIAIGN